MQVFEMGASIIHEENKYFRYISAMTICTSQLTVDTLLPTAKMTMTGLTVQIRAPCPSFARFQMCVNIWP